MYRASVALIQSISLDLCEKSRLSSKEQAVGNQLERHAGLPLRVIGCLTNLCRTLRLAVAEGCVISNSKGLFELVPGNTSQRRSVGAKTL